MTRTWLPRRFSIVDHVILLTLASLATSANSFDKQNILYDNNLIKSLNYDKFSPDDSNRLPYMWPQPLRSEFPVGEYSRPSGGIGSRPRFLGIRELIQLMSESPNLMKYFGARDNTNFDKPGMSRRLFDDAPSGGNAEEVELGGDTVENSDNLGIAEYFAADPVKRNHLFVGKRAPKFVGKRSVDAQLKIRSKRSTHEDARHDLPEAHESGEKKTEMGNNSKVIKQGSDDNKDASKNKRAHMFVGKRGDGEGEWDELANVMSGNPVKEKSGNYEERSRMFEGKHMIEEGGISEDKRRMFVGKREGNEDEISEDKRRMFVGKREEDEDEISEDKRRMFVGKRQEDEDEISEDKRRMFVGKREEDEDEISEDKRRMFVGKREEDDEEDDDALSEDKRRMFVGKRPRFVGKRPRFVGKRPRFVGKRRMFVGKRPRFVGKRPRFVGKRPRFVGKRINEESDGILGGTSTSDQYFLDGLDRGNEFVASDEAHASYEDTVNM